MTLSLPALENQSSTITSYLPNNAVIVGAIATALATHLFFSLNVIIPFEEFRREFENNLGFWFYYNPFSTLQWMGGFVGGYVAGYFTREAWYNAFLNGIKAVVIGMFLFYITDTIFILHGAFESGVLTSSIFIGIVAQRFIFMLIPVTLIYLFQSMSISAIGNQLSNTLAKTELFQLPAVDSIGALTLLIRGSRAVFSYFVFQSIFVFLWWVLYSIQYLSF